MTRPLRIVLVGYGPVGARFVEEVLPAVAAGEASLVALGAEDEDAYNRVLVAEYAVGVAARDRLDVTDTEAARAAGADIRLAETAVTIDRVRQRVLTSGGDELPYDRLVLATGSRANIPTLDGLERTRRERDAAPGADVDRGRRPLPGGVVALRDVADADSVAPVVAAGGAIVVLGAGVLGMEFALLAAEHGAQVVVVHHGPTPMARNLDEAGGRMLARAVRTAGVGMAAHARAESIGFRDTEGGRVFDGVGCADGTYIPGDLLVLSCGVGPRVELALAAGLACSAGVLVDEELRSWSDPDVFAIGDCAQVAAPEDADASGRVPGAPSGLIGPGWRQAAALARRLRAEAAGAVAGAEAAVALHERPTAVMLKATGIDVVAGGDHAAEPWDADAEVTVWLDPARGCYLKTVVREGVLTGFVSVGLPQAGAELTLLFERGAALPAEPSALLRLDAADAGAVAVEDPLGPDATVCWCNGVTAGRIGDAVADGCDTVEAVGRCTRAGTGCGGCKGRIAAILAAAPVG
ncbi:FAD-dependent oxidoreductase [Leifsonia shinshuensis]|uniref:NAD(P)/FAD-dependent oxidoreductase n=1 Tax=Leifsonia shinshuensis TaxID=150026 RepID=A0A7G6YE24_9MICO|nr:FAD-dependent oxidoreductase [Leifsonia shinshuensis]QNE36739.1 NAD(P)/FAD-dependent oxidoreductase [Leifsonia shinshuensis]